MGETCWRGSDVRREGPTEGSEVREEVTFKGDTCWWEGHTEGRLCGERQVQREGGAREAEDEGVAEGRSSALRGRRDGGKGRAGRSGDSR